MRRPYLVLEPGAQRVPLRKSGERAGLPHVLGLRLIWLERMQDVNGHSGIGIVAGGVVFPNGRVVLRWYTDTATTVHFDSPQAVAAIHGHDGATRVMMTSEISTAPSAEEVK